uniref:Uncharacterized protein n=1 Tax=Strigamia maritima TaxID=126957 RepID=T1IXE6_STRMM
MQMRDVSHPAVVGSVFGRFRRVKPQLCDESQHSSVKLARSNVAFGTCVKLNHWICPLNTSGSKFYF